MDSPTAPSASSPSTPQHAAKDKLFDDEAVEAEEEDDPESEEVDTGSEDESEEDDSAGSTGEDDEKESPIKVLKSDKKSPKSPRRALVKKSPQQQQRKLAAPGKATTARRPRSPSTKEPNGSSAKKARTAPVPALHEGGEFNLSQARVSQLYSKESSPPMSGKYQIVSLGEPVPVEIISNAEGQTTKVIWSKCTPKHYSHCYYLGIDEKDIRSEKGKLGNLKSAKKATTWANDDPRFRRLQVFLLPQDENDNCLPPYFVGLHDACGTEQYDIKKSLFLTEAGQAQCRAAMKGANVMSNTWPLRVALPWPLYNKLAPPTPHKPAAATTVGVSASGKKTSAASPATDTRLDEFNKVWDRLKKKAGKNMPARYLQHHVTIEKVLAGHLRVTLERDKDNTIATLDSHYRMWFNKICKVLQDKDLLDKDAKVSDQVKAWDEEVQSWKADKKGLHQAYMEDVLRVVPLTSTYAATVVLKRYEQAYIEGHANGTNGTSSSSSNGNGNPFAGSII